MTRLLLDYPWPLDQALNPGSGGCKVLLEFEKLVRRKRLTPLPFIEQNDFESAKHQLGKGPVAAQILRFSNHLIRNGENITRAIPNPEPTPALTDCWRRALRDELTHLENWRSPQIIFPEIRRSVWPTTDEIEIKCEDRTDSVSRVLASLEAYELHPYAISDLDPWDVRCTAVSGKHPCYLPNPLMPGKDPMQNDCYRVPIAQLLDELIEARRRGWDADGKYCYIPPANWRPEAISQMAWRQGRAFPRTLCPVRKQKGYSDFEGRIWLWHKGRGAHIGEDHWDVQFGGKEYFSVNHTGDLL